VCDLSAADVARVGVSQAAATAADLLTRVATGEVDQPATVAEFLARADSHRQDPTAPLRTIMRTRQIIAEGVLRAITYALLAGASWQDIADVLRFDEESVVSAYRHCDLSHLASDPDAVWEVMRRTCPRESRYQDADPAVVARQISEWASARRA